MALPERPRLATTEARSLRWFSRALTALIVLALLGLWAQATRRIVEDGQRLALQLAERHLRNVVWLEGQRVLREEGGGALERRVGADPRDWLGPAVDADGRAIPDPLRGAAWGYSPASRQLCHRAVWHAAGRRCWQVMAERRAGTAVGLRLEVVQGKP
jgi:hypothetical protein